MGCDVGSQEGEMKRVLRNNFIGLSNEDDMIIEKTLL